MSEPADAIRQANQARAAAITGQDPDPAIDPWQTLQTATGTILLPATVPLSALVSLLVDLGIPEPMVTGQLLGFHADQHGVRAEIYATDEHGKRYVDQGSLRVATHQIAIRLDRTR